MPGSQWFHNMPSSVFEKQLFRGSMWKQLFFLKIGMIVWGSQYLLTKFGTPLYNGHCNLESPLLPTHVVLNFMDPIIGWMFFQREVDRISKSVWKTIKCIGSLLEAENDDFDNDFFYMPPNSLLELIFTKLQNCLDVDCGRRHSHILLDYHLKICNQVLYPKPS